MFKVGMSSTGFALTEENFAALRKSNVSAVEISMKPELYKDINYKEVKTLSEKYGVGLWSYHLPFSPFSEVDISFIDKAKRDNTVSYLSELIKKAADIGIDKFVIHASGEPISDEQRPERLKASMESLDILAETAHKCGGVIAVEDLPRTCLGNTSDEMKALISANGKLRVCFDTNHLLKDDNISFMKKLADKIITVHISDYDFINERHWLPGEGKLDWIKMLETFKEIGYSGIWLYEIGLKCPKTIIRDRDLTFDDFYNNAASIFAGEAPQVFSTHKENLGMWE